MWRKGRDVLNGFKHCCLQSRLLCCFVYFYSSSVTEKAVEKIVKE